MRTAALIFALCLPVSVAASPEITVHVPQQNIRQIIAVIRAATQDPILGIHPVYESQRVPGSIPVKAFESGPFKDGKVQMKPIIKYERTDRVSVRTGPDENLTGGSYFVQKVDGKWKIQSKGFWIH